MAYTGYARVAAARARRYATPNPAPPAKREDFRAYLATVWGFPLCITHIAGKDARGPAYARRRQLSAKMTLHRPLGKTMFSRALANL